MTNKFCRVSGFNPRFIVWWIKGCRTPTPATFPTRRLATSIRQNLYALREAMRLEGHHASALIERGEIIRRPVDNNRIGIEDPHILTIRPVNFDMNDILDAAGIDLDPTDSSEDLPEITEPTTYPECPRPFDYAATMKGSSFSYGPTDNGPTDEGPTDE